MTDELQTWSYFASNVYIGERPDFLKVLDTVATELVLATKKQNTMSELYPMYHTANFVDDPRLQDFRTYIELTAWNILDSQGYDMSMYNALAHEIWCQEHYKFSNQELHMHGFGSQISGFYFLNCPENCGRPIIHDPRPTKHYADLPEKTTDAVTAATKIINFEPKPGMLMFSNSWLPHSFSRHGNRKPFKFIHFNIGVVYNGNAAPLVPEAIVV
jgi:hypothetical protein